MVSLWPWKADSNSAASFEKTLSGLATKISKASSRNDSLRQQARRARVSLVLYGGFAYILVFLILTLVTGWRNWGAYEYTIVAGGPPVLYGIRVALITYFNWRTTSSQAYLDGLYKERDATIEKLKTATKYNSTQQLLDKYASPRPSPKQQKDAAGKQQSPKGQKGAAQEPRVFRQPPPTANIRRDQPSAPSLPSTPQQGQPPRVEAPSSPSNAAPQPQSPMSPVSAGASPGAEFAPNAFGDAPAQYAPGVAQSRWYDRIMDALLGEDETQARNRIALICRQCRLVNGQAPPGTKSLEEVGRWRCSACGSWNGVESETSKLVQQLAAQRDDQASPAAAGPSPTNDIPSNGDAEEGDAVIVSREADEEAERVQDTPAKSTRSRAGGKKK